MAIYRQASRRRTLLGGCDHRSSVKVLLCVDLRRLRIKIVGFFNSDLQERTPSLLLYFIGNPNDTFSCF